MGKWKFVDEHARSVYMIQWNLRSEIAKEDYEPYTRLIRNDKELQLLMNDLCKPELIDDVIILSVWKRVDVEYEE